MLWIKTLGKLLWWIVLFLAGMVLASGILTPLGLQFTLVNRIAAAIFFVIAMIFTPRLAGTLLDKFRVEEQIRLRSRKHPEIRAQILVVGIVAIYFVLVIGTFVSFVIGYYILLAIFIFLMAVLFIEFLLILSLLPKLLIGVEGGNDIEFLKTIARTLHAQDENIPDLEKLEANGDIIFLPLGGSNLKLWVARLEVFSRHEFYIFDRDNKPPALPKYHATITEINKRRRCKAISTNKREMENYLHPAAIKAVYPMIDVKFSDFDDVAFTVAQALHDIRGSTPWAKLSENKKEQKIKTIKKSLNTKVVEQMTPQLIDERDVDGELRDWLNYISQKVEE